MSFAAAIRDLRFAIAATDQAIRAGEKFGPEYGLAQLRDNNAERKAALTVLEEAQKGGSNP